MAADRKECVTVLSTNVNTAFDSDLNPVLMIHKLKADGYSDISLNLMRSLFELRRNK